MQCLITFEPCHGDYSQKGLRKLSANLTSLSPFKYSAAEQIKEALIRVKKMSIQGMQPKLSAVLNSRKKSFDVVDRFGRFIIKPPNRDFPEMPENEALTMRLAQHCGIEVPVHGLLRSRDGSLSYFIERFDRVGARKKLHVEDFSQITGESRDTKYNSSLEKVADVLKACSFPAVAKSKLFLRCLFNWVTGNEDMHLKNYSLIYRNNTLDLAPGYDLLNSTLIWRLLGESQQKIEESALPLAGKKRRFTRNDWFDYLGKERMKLPEKVTNRCLNCIVEAMPMWQAEIQRSWLSANAKRIYWEIIDERINRLVQRNQSTVLD